MNLFVAITGGLITVAILYLLYNYVRRFHIDLFYSLRYYIDQPRPPQTMMEYRAVRAILAFVKFVARHIPALSFFEELALGLRRARIPLTPAEYLVASTLAVIVIGFVFASLTFNPYWTIFSVVVVILAAVFFVRYRIYKRREKFTNQLGDCLTTVANALRAGFSFLQAMDLVSREMEPPISEEFAHCMRDISYGMAMEEALENMDERVGSKDFNLVVVAVLIQRQVGGNLAQVLDTISDTINNRIRMKREVKTLTTQGRLSAYILIGLPILIASLMLAIDSAHFDEMMENPIGKFILIVAIILEIIGAIVIWKIVDIKVE